MDLSLHKKTLSILLKERASKYKNKTFIKYYGKDYSYSEIYISSLKIASGLVHAGIKPKQNIAIMMDNSPEVLLIHFALGLIGAVAVPINTAARGDLLAYYINQSDSFSIFLDGVFATRLSEVIPKCGSLKTAVVIKNENSPELLDFDLQQLLQNVESVSWETIISSESDAIEFIPHYSDTLHILYSSGTTGAAKGSIVPNATALITAEKHVEIFGYVESDILFTCLPLFHGNALNCTVLPALIAGATVALSKRFSTSKFWNEINESQATHTSLLSAMINFLWLKEPSTEEKTHQLKTCIVVPTPEFSLDFEIRYNVKVTSLYGLGDFGFATMLRHDDPREKIRSAGRALPEVNVAILDEDDIPVPTGEVGQICLRTVVPWFSRQGYYNLDALWVKVIRNLWVHTGDRGWLDSDGYLFFAGRDKELIRRRGENISSIQVEEILRRHPAVADAAIYAVKAEYLEDEVMASIVFKDGCSTDFAALVTFCSLQLADFMVPRFWEILFEFPMTLTGKVEKYKLQESAKKRLFDIWDREKSGIKLQK